MICCGKHSYCKIAKTRGELKEKISIGMNMKKENMNANVSNSQHFQCINFLANLKIMMIYHYIVMETSQDLKKKNLKFCES